MISDMFALDQLSRIMGIVGFPRGPESGSYVAEMRKAIASADSEQIAEMVVTDLLRAFKRVPSVSDIYEAVTAENERHGRVRRLERPRYECYRCTDCGFYGGDLPPSKFAGPWKWCDCRFAAARRNDEPGLVDNANANREKLLRLQCKIKTVPDAKPEDYRDLEQYHGSF